MASVDAAISGEEHLLIDFTKEQDAASKATWSADALSITPRGFEVDGDFRAQDGWIQTVPLATGLSWRPATMVGVRVVVKPVPKAVVSDNDHVIPPSAGEMYARYSPDAKHWSTWQPLSSTTALTEGATEMRYEGALSVPRREMQEYWKLLSEYDKQDVPWVDDEEAAVKWILSRDPSFFERSLPFIGYVEFLYEASFRRDQPITTFVADVSYMVGGLTREAKDPKAAEDLNTPWRFRAK